MIKNDAMKSLADAEGKAFFLKMVGDYYRYNTISLHGSLEMVLLSAALIMLATVDIDVT